MSNDTAECGCEGHADNFGPCQFPALRDAATELYKAAHWKADRSVDSAGLWTALRDALGLAPGSSPKPVADVAPTKLVKCDECDDGRWVDASHGCSRRCGKCEGSGKLKVVMKPYEEARNAFNAYAAMNGPDLPDDELSAIQVAFSRWEVANFGYQPPDKPAMGMAEEFGEAMMPLANFLGFGGAIGRLSHIVLKSSQKIRGFADPEYTREQLSDAIADVWIFGFNLCTHFRIDAGTILRATARKVLKRDWTKDPSGKKAD